MKVKGDEITEKSQGLGGDKRLLARHKPQASQSFSYLLRGNLLLGPLCLLPVKPECRVRPLKQPYVSLLSQTYKKPELCLGARGCGEREVPQLYRRGSRFLTSFEEISCTGVRLLSSSETRVQSASHQTNLSFSSQANFFSVWGGRLWV